MVEKLHELHALTDDEVVARYNAAAGSTVVGTGFYLEELARRRSERASATLIRLTWAIVALTVVLVILTLVLTADALQLLPAGQGR